MIVIDVGCARYGGDYSIERLLEEFKPDLLFGFDPTLVAPEPPDVPDWLPSGDLDPDLEMHFWPRAAWIYDGEIAFFEDGLNSHVGEGGGMVPCFDLARFIKDLPETDIVLKMDAEMAEYTILPHLIEQGADEKLSLAWIEWHPFWKGDPKRRKPIEDAMRCEMREWRF